MKSARTTTAKTEIQELIVSSSMALSHSEIQKSLEGLLVNSNEKGTTKAYMVNEFIYNKEVDTYTCPQGETLTTTGTWHKKLERAIAIRLKNIVRQNAKNVQ